MNTFWKIVALISALIGGLLLALTWWTVAGSLMSSASDLAVFAGMVGTPLVIGSLLYGLYRLFVLFFPLASENK